MTTLEEIAVPDEARCKCSGSSLPRSTYSQEIIFRTSLGGRMGIPDIAVVEVEVDCSEVNEVVLVLVSERGDTGEGKAGRRGGRLGPEGVVIAE